LRGLSHDVVKELFAFGTDEGVNKQIYEVAKADGWYLRHPIALLAIIKQHFFSPGALASQIELLIAIYGVTILATGLNETPVQSLSEVPLPGVVVIGLIGVRISRLSSLCLLIVCCKFRHALEEYSPGHWVEFEFCSWDTLHSRKYYMAAENQPSINNLAAIVAQWYVGSP
jgi:hypothetical protein